MANDTRNPLVIPTEKPAGRARGCPKCGSEEWSGRTGFGMAIMKCRECGNEWAGGVGQEPYDPREPIPPQNPAQAPLVDFERNAKTGQVDEFRVRRSDPTQPFRRGLPVPPPGEEENG